MQKIQYVSKYLTLAQEGLVPKTDCPLDQGLLMCNMDNNEDIYLYCLSCDYKKIIGFALYNNIVKMVGVHEKNI